MRRSFTGRRVLGSQSLRGKRKFHTASRWLIMMLLFALFHVATRVQVVQAGYEIQRLMDRRELLQGERNALTVEVISLRSPVRLDRIAGKIGLRRPHQDHVSLISLKTP